MLSSNFLYVPAQRNREGGGRQLEEYLFYLLALFPASDIIGMPASPSEARRLV